MLRHFAFVGCLVVGIATLTAAAPAVGPGAGLARRPADTPLGRLITGNFGRLLVLRSELNLTPAQKTEIRGILVSHRTEIATTIQAVHAKRTALGQAILQGKSESEVRAAADALGDVIADTAVKAVKLRNQLAPVLTDEQQTLIGQFVKDKDNSIERFLEQAVAAQ